jgi:hypothetical protein
MIFDHGGKAFDGGVQGGAFGNGPGFEGAGDFEAKVVVEAGGAMALDAKAVAGSGIAFTRRGFGCFVEAAFAAVVV